MKIAAGVLALSVGVVGAYGEQFLRGEDPCNRSGDPASWVTAPLCSGVQELASLVRHENNSGQVA
ncbi:MAG TPA: hypothetical protein VKQ34_05040 [Candidatus Saccharimonadales bacterium]|nr:hypothetical protein [Candidatus Saccharimonadales bacterium]